MDELAESKLVSITIPDVIPENRVIKYDVPGHGLSLSLALSLSHTHKHSISFPRRNIQPIFFFLSFSFSSLSSDVSLGCSEYYVRVVNRAS